MEEREEDMPGRGTSVSKGVWSAQNTVLRKRSGWKWSYKGGSVGWYKAFECQLESLAFVFLAVRNQDGM